LNILPDFVKARPKIKLIVIDSIAFHFRADVIDVTGRNRVLSSIASNLNQLAYNEKLAVVVMNHVTSKIVRSTDSFAARGSVSISCLFM
jgi:RAD51-like protein 2